MSSIDETTGAVVAETKTRHLLLISQSLFFVALAWCLILNHGPTAENDGISFYGVYHETVPLIVAGYAAAFVGLWRTSVTFRGAGVPALTWAGLRVIAALLLVLLATPFNHGAFLNWTHMAAGITGALLELEVALQLVRESRSLRTVLGLAVLLLGGVISAASLPDWHFTHLLQGEIVFQMGFAWCLIEWTYALADRTRTI
jgi:hypothetical protein